MSIYDYTIKSGKGEDVALSDYKGKVMMIVNTATGDDRQYRNRLRFHTSVRGHREDV